MAPNVALPGFGLFLPREMQSTFRGEASQSKKDEANPKNAMQIVLGTKNLGNVASECTCVLELHCDRPIRAVS